MREAVYTNSSAHKKGPPAFGGPSLGRNTPRSKNNSRAIATSIWRVIVSGCLRSNMKMAAGSFLRNRGCEVMKSETSDFR